MSNAVIATGPANGSNNSASGAGGGQQPKIFEANVDSIIERLLEGKYLLFKRQDSLQLGEVVLGNRSTWLRMKFDIFVWNRGKSFYPSRSSWSWRHRSRFAVSNPFPHPHHHRHHLKETFTDSIMTCCACSSMAGSRPRPTISSWETMWTAGSKA